MLSPFGTSLESRIAPLTAAGFPSFLCLISTNREALLFTHGPQDPRRPKAFHSTAGTSDDGPGHCVVSGTQDRLCPAPEMFLERNGPVLTD